ncbi:hypothetical protein WG66_007331 [Moniliophthora roreri]|nr:hypothetical protein WG66_007331 [Moniliophthora roreri]
MITIALGNLVVLLHVWSIWERKSRFVKGIMALYIATHLASIVSLATAVLMIISVTTFSHELRLCIMSDRDVSFTMLWVPELVFEVSMLDAVIWNALDRPRSEKGELEDMLHRDGIMYFAILTGEYFIMKSSGGCSIGSVLRLANLILSVTVPLSLIFLGVVQSKSCLFETNRPLTDS